MKRINNLYDRICSLDNLCLADQKARRGKLHTHGVILFDKDRHAKLQTLHEILVAGTYKTSHYDIFKIYEPKERTIYRLPYYPDRIVHHAIMNILEPIWLSIFTRDTYSCIKGRGIHATARQVKFALCNEPENTRYCLKIDIKKFYPSIDHAILKEIVRKKIKDVRLLFLLDEIIDSAEGLPIGNYLSQYFANLYLAYFDHWIKEEKKQRYYYRYADDIVVLSCDKEELQNLLRKIQSKLSDLKLQVKENYQVFPIDSRGLDFVGYVFYHDHILLRKRIKKNLCRKVAKLTHLSNRLSQDQIKRALCSWKGWAKYSNSRNLLYTLSKQLNYDLQS